MALRFLDSCLHYSASEVAAKYLSNTYTINATGNRWGGQALQSTSSNNSFTKVLDAQATYIVGFAYRSSAITNTQIVVLRLIDGATTQVALSQTATGAMIVQRGGPTTLATTTTVFTSNTDYYIELFITISDAAGVVKMNVNGVAETLTFVTGNSTNQDTKNSANASADRIQFATGSAGQGVTTRYSDIYICDGTGSTNNDLLGDMRVECLFPNGTGNSSQFVNDAGNSTNNYSHVDETTPNGDTDYVESGTVNDKDTYTFTDMIATSGSVYGVQILHYEKKTDAQVRKVGGIARLSSTETTGADEVLTTAYQYGMSIAETKPGGGAWSIGDVNNAEFGQKVTA